MLSKVNDAYDLVKNGLDVTIALANADQKELLADAKIALSELKTTISELKDENLALQKRLKVIDELILRDGVYWQKDTPAVQPFCPVCFQDGYQIPLQAFRKNTQETTFNCPKCKATYNPFDYHNKPNKYASGPRGY